MAKYSRTALNSSGLAPLAAEPSAPVAFSAPSSSSSVLSFLLPRTVLPCALLPRAVLPRRGNHKLQTTNYKRDQLKKMLDVRVERFCDCKQQLAATKHCRIDCCDGTDANSRRKLAHAQQSRPPGRTFACNCTYENALAKMPPKSCVANGDAPTACPCARAPDLARLHSTPKVTNCEVSFVRRTRPQKRVPRNHINAAIRRPQPRPAKSQAQTAWCHSSENRPRNLRGRARSRRGFITQTEPSVVMSEDV